MSSNQSSSTPSAVSRSGSQRSPGVVARAAGERDGRAVASRRSPRRWPRRRRNEARRRRAVGEPATRVLAHEVDQRLSAGTASAPGRTVSSPADGGRAHVEEIDGQPVVGCAAPGGDAGPLPPRRARRRRLWAPFLAAHRRPRAGPAGLRAHGKRGDLDYSIEGYDAFARALPRPRGVERVAARRARLGLARPRCWAQRIPERVERLVVIDAVPFLARLPLAPHGPRLAHALARASCSWAPPARASSGAMSREANVTPGPLPERLDRRWWRDFDQGTQRAILRLYRGARGQCSPPPAPRLGAARLPRAGRLGRPRSRTSRRASPTATRQVLGGPDAPVVPDAGHWPWLDRPDLVPRRRRGSSLDERPPSA